MKKALISFPLFLLLFLPIFHGNNSLFGIDPVVPLHYENPIGMKFRLIAQNASQGISLPFYISVFCVTQSEYEKIIGSNPSFIKGSNHPVDSVSFYDAEVFCAKLSRIDNRHYRIPREIEWEYACRAGSKSKYFWGDTIDENYLWYENNSLEKYHPVGLKKPNSFGLFDMLGNVWQWCDDIYEIRRSDGSGILCQCVPKYRALRGGSCLESQRGCQINSRNWGDPNLPFILGGIRVVCDPPK